jgi:hypothetical protein
MFRSAPLQTRRRHRGRRLLLAVVILAGVLVAADRITLVVAERAAATTIQRSQHLNSAPSVTVAGFPFLTQLATGDFSKISVRADGVQAGSGSRALRIARVEVVLHRVHVPRDLSRVEADSATATGTISYADLSKTLGITMGYGGLSHGAGRVRATASVTVAGQQISGTISAGVQLSGSDLEFVDPQLGVDGSSIPAAAVPLLQSVFGAPLSLASLPFGVKVTGVHATAQGVTIDLSGADLVYTRS